MTDNNETLSVERLADYNDADASELGQLIAQLSPHFGVKPVARDWIEKIIDSPYHDLIVARLNGHIVGTATLSIILHPAHDQIGYLEAFVVDANVRGRGVGDLVWQEVTKWCNEHSVQLAFTSNAKREAAHKFYLKHGAIARETTVFQYDPQ